MGEDAVDIETGAIVAVTYAMHLGGVEELVADKGYHSNERSTFYSPPSAIRPRAIDECKYLNNVIEHDRRQ
jgi:hypothetical protein